ncbi:MAG: efflux RND transporter permease subunit [Candidatus Eisenbacteria bacterium]
MRGLRTSASGSAVALDVQGDDLGELQRIAADLMVRLQDVPGLENLEPSAEEASPELTIELDRERAAYLGLSWLQSDRPFAPRSTGRFRPVSVPAIKSTTCG